MPIIGALPVMLSNGTTADASQVMTDLNFIVNAVNAGVAPLGTLDAPSGTRMSFHQAAAPTGWVTDATITNHAGLFSAATGFAGSTVSAQTNFSFFLGGLLSTAGHTLTAAEIPSHTHNLTVLQNAAGGSGTSGIIQGTIGPSTTTYTTDAGTGGNQAHSHTLSTLFNYVGLLIAQKS